MENWTLTWTKLTSIKDTSNLSHGIPGVYRLSYLDENGSYYVFYVGQATDIKKRLLEHQSDSETNVRIKNYLSSKKCFFRYAKITQDYVRNAVERQTYKYYQPSCNDKEPEGRDDIQGNLT